MKTRKKILNMIHSFFIIKGHIHHMRYQNIINSYHSSPGLFNIAEKHKIDVVLVYNIMREYRINKLNKNIILTIKGNIK